LCRYLVARCLDRADAVNLLKVIGEKLTVKGKSRNQESSSFAKASEDMKIRN
jgi:hypothetical protein